MPEIVYADVRVPVSEHTAALYEWQRLDLIKHPSNRNPPRWWFSFRIGAYRKTGTHSGGSALDERVSCPFPRLRRRPDGAAARKEPIERVGIAISLFFSPVPHSC